MPQEPFVSLARIRVLLVPVGSIERDAFEKWAKTLYAIDRISLSDIPEDRQGRGKLYLIYLDY